MYIIDFLLPIIELLGYVSAWFILIIAFIESLAFLGLIIPGTIILVVFGFLAAKGLFNISELVLFAGIGALLGDTVSYYLGRKFSKIFKNDKFLFLQKYIKSGERFLLENGKKSIFLGRFAGSMRPIIPFVCGMQKNDPKKFFFWNIFSAFLWSLCYLLIGFFLGETWQVIKIWSPKIQVIIVVLIIILIIFSILKWLLLKKGKGLLRFLKSIFISIKKALAENAEVQKFIDAHPTVFGFIKNRLTRKKFSGLFLTIILILLFYILILMYGVTRDILTSSTIVKTDVRVENLFYAFRSLSNIKFFLWITILGKWQVATAGTLIFAVILWIWNKKFYIIPLAISVVASSLFTYLGKFLFEVPRPIFPAYTESLFSFPSGHATVAFALYGFITYFLIRNTKSLKNKINAFFAGITVIAIVGISRIYLGVHFLSDILGGYLSGALWLLVAIWAAEWISFNKTNIKITEKRKRKVFATIILIFLWIALYVGFAATYSPKLVSATEAHPINYISDDVLNIFSNGFNYPKYSETLSGTNQEPISLIIIAQSDQSLISAFNNAGWFLADKPNVNSMLKLGQAGILNQEYDKAPMTPVFWNGVVHDLGFQKPTSDKSVRSRHHTRFWKTDVELKDKGFIYVGTASLDEGLKWLVTHKIDPNIDGERDLIFNDLTSAGAIANSSKVKLVDPLLSKNFSGDPFFTDGEAYIIYLK